MGVDTAPPGAGLETVGGRYRLLQLLVPPTDVAPGVWRGADTVLNRPVMVTVVEPGGTDPRSAALLECAHGMSLVEHPSVPRVFDAADEGDRSWVVTEWVEGNTLAALLAEDGPLDAAEAASTVLRLADGVARVHQVGLPVGTLDPEHVVITPRGSVTVVRLAVGTVGTAYDDVKHLGALLYYGLTGSWPLTRYGAAQVADVPDGRLPSPRQVRAGVPAELSTITMRALDPHQPEPLVSAQDLGEALTRWHRDADPEPFMADLPFEERYAPPERRRGGRRWAPLIAFVAGFAVIALIAFGVNALLGKRDPNSPGTPVATSSATPTPTPSRSTVLPGPIQALAVTMYDPAGDGQENASKAPLAMDGDPATAWPTLEYRRTAAFGNLKPGVGLTFDLGHTAAVGSVTLATTEPGTAVEIRVGDAPDGPLDSYKVVGSSASLTASTTISLSQASGRYYVVWFTKLAPTPGGTFQGDLAEVQFLP